MKDLIVQTYVNGQWRDALRMEFPFPEKGREGPCYFSYVDAYLDDFICFVGDVGPLAVSGQYPLGFHSYKTPGWPAFLFDIMPAGAARRYLEKHLELSQGPPHLHDFQLLSSCTISPVGHLRIKTSREPGAVVAFTREDVLSRERYFLEYAASRGASIGGGTGAGGDAPKLLLVEDVQGNLYLDPELPEDEIVQHWFVKFPRRSQGQDQQRHQLILETEALYYKVLRQLGLSVVGPVIYEASAYTRPCLWLPRFDRAVSVDSTALRWPVESIYSLMGSTRPGSSLSHTEVLRTLTTLLKEHGMPEQVPILATEYVKRDLLNVILGNADNHGRNMSLFRHEDAWRWTPIYDLAPMVIDPEGITRSTRWSRDVELGGRIDWLAVCASLEWIAPASFFVDALKDFARVITPLPDLLLEAGMSQKVLEFQGVYLQELPETLKTWGLA